MQNHAARGDVYYPLHCYSLSHLVPSLLTGRFKMQYQSYLTYLSDFNLRLVCYFLLGGVVTALTAYFASMGKGTLSAFIATLPLLTALTFILIYVEGGDATVGEYARGLLLFTPPWLCYVFVVLLGVERWGIFKSVALGIVIYVILSVILQKMFLGLGTKM